MGGDDTEKIAHVMERLSRSGFRSGFRLGAKEREYLLSKGMDAIQADAFRFITERLASANPTNDGRQTPMKNHPVFIAQHATGTCCRKCLQKWHGIEKGVAMTDDQTRYIVDVICSWLRTRF